MTTFNPSNVFTSNEQKQIKSNIGYCGCIQCHLHEEGEVFDQDTFHNLEHKFNRFASKLNIL